MGAFRAEKSVTTPGRASSHGRTNGTAKLLIAVASRTSGRHRRLIRREVRRSGEKMKELAGMDGAS
jgi:hypothetical protein